MKNKFLLSIVCALVFVLSIPASGFAATANENYVKAYDYTIPSSYTVKGIDSDSKGNVYYVALTDASHAKLFALSPTGKIKWSIAAPAGEEMYMMTDLADNIYINIGKTITSYSPEGKKRWTKTEKSFFFMSAGKDGIVLSSSKRLWAYNPSGKLLYDVNLSSDSKVTVPDIGYGFWSKTESRSNIAPSVDIYEASRKLFTATSKTGQYLKFVAASVDRKTIYIADMVTSSSHSGHLFAYDLKGTLKWTYTFATRKSAQEAVVMDNGSLVLKSSTEDKIYALSPEGKLIWENEIAGGNRAPLNTNANIVYFGNTLYDKDGNILVTVENHNGLDYFLAMDGSILFTSADTITRYVVKYSDAMTSWAYPAINRLITAGIIGGYPDGTFKPGNSVTKEEFVKLLVGSAPAVAAGSATGSFSDVTSTRWSSGVISEAVKRGIVIPAEEGALFRPASAITREQMAVYVARALSLSTGAPSVPFTDHAVIGKLPLVNAAASRGLIGGYPDGSFKPKNNLTRAETAVIITRVLDFAG